MLLLILAGILSCQPDDQREHLDFLRLSYRANKESFLYGSFRFEYTRGLSASLADAESEVFSKAFKEDGFFVFDGANALYQLTADPKVLTAATTRIDGRPSSSLIGAFRMVTDGKATLYDSIQLNWANATLLHSPKIVPGRTEFGRDGIFEFPLYVGDNSLRDYDLFSDLKVVEDGKASLDDLDLDSRLNDRKVCKLTFTYEYGTRTYFIDVNRGSVPLRIVDHFNPSNVDVTFIFSDLAHLPNAGWLPLRRLHIIRQGRSVLLDRIVVKEIDTEKKPPRSAFELEFPEPISVHDAARKLLYPKRKTWSLLRLPGPSSPGTTAVTAGTFPPPVELPGEIEPSSAWPAILAAGVVLLVAAGWVVVLRRRNRRAKGPVRA
jgi:hypothetical protein